ncbi:MAG: hypothetical protein H0V42_13140 [Nocardioidaceae bacterium]|nr:hypothetical protein [Nocardioidaceae bacterium]
MSVMQATRTYLGEQRTQSRAPYRVGDRISITGPTQETYVARVEKVTPVSPGSFSLLAAVVAPRNLRSQVITTCVDADGLNSVVCPAA